MMSTTGIKRGRKKQSSPPPPPSNVFDESIPVVLDMIREGTNDNDGPSFAFFDVRFYVQGDQLRQRIHQQGYSDDIDFAVVNSLTYFKAFQEEILEQFSSMTSFNPEVGRSTITLLNQVRASLLKGPFSDWFWRVSLYCHVNELDYYVNYITDNLGGIEQVLLCSKG